MSHCVTHPELFQFLLLIAACFSFSTGGQISYSLPYLQARDSDLQLWCTPSDGSPAHYCDADTACDSSKTSSFEYLTDTDHTLVNWVVTFKLACVSDERISLEGTYFFAGFLVSAAIFPSLADLVGRKPIILSGLLLHIAINLALQWITSEAFLIVYLVLLGIRLPMASHVSFLLLMEYLPPSRRACFGNFVSAFDGGFSIFIALAFYYLRDWHIWFFIVDGENLLLFLSFLIFIPESPRYLISKRRFQAARRVFSRLAWCNRAKQI